MIWRGYMDHVYGTCARTNRKWPLSDMSWDNGLLVCNDVVDGVVLGAIENAWARETARDRQELLPDPKLIHPVDPLSQIETLPASSGVY
jgi:hypothetical protein